MPKSSSSRLIRLVLGAALASSVFAPAVASALGGASFFTLSLEELSSIVVTSPSRFEEGLLKSPHAVSVITAEDIRRSGVRSIPEALALAPGVHVAYKNGNRWIVNMGGLGLEEFSNKLLVLVDNVTVYSNLFGSVDWDLLPVSLGEVERIEVIRGPGGVLYGANAVNGVISIITQDPADSTPPRLSVGADEEGGRTLQAGIGVAEGDGMALRASLGYVEDQGFDLQTGGDMRDYQRLYAASARASVRLGEKSTLGMDGRFLGGEFLLPQTSNFAFIPESLRQPQSGIFRLRFDRETPRGSQVYLQAFARRQLVLEDDGSSLSEVEDSRTLDFEFQHLRPHGEDGRHTLTFGGGHRLVSAQYAILAAGEREYTVSNLFLYERFRVRPDLQLGAGLKWEAAENAHETFPARLDLVWSPSEVSALRLGLSTSHRSPTLLENYQEIVLTDPFGPGSSLQLLGNTDLETEKITTLEVGYHGNPSSGVYLDLAWRRMEYRDLIIQEEVTPYPDLGYNFFNVGEATVESAELGVTAQLADRVRAFLGVGAVWSELDEMAKIQYEESPRSLQPESTGNAGVSFTGPGGVEADLRGYYLQGIPANDVDDRWRIDLNLAKSFALSDGDVRLALSCRNLLEEEFAQAGRLVSVPASFRFSLEWMGR